MEKKDYSSDQAEFHFLFLMSSQTVMVEDNMAITLLNPDSKTLYMTARPGRDRAFIPTDRFLTIWMNHNDTFKLSPPQIGIIHSGMTTDSNGISQNAFSINLLNPIKGHHGDWTFNLAQTEPSLLPGNYSSVTFFIDWSPNINCPLPIKLILPSLFKDTRR